MTNIELSAVCDALNILLWIERPEKSGDDPSVMARVWVQALEADGIEPLFWDVINERFCTGK